MKTKDNNLSNFAGRWASITTSLVVILSGISATAHGAIDSAKSIKYGVDVSFPIHHSVSTMGGSVKQPLGDRQSLYLQHLQACRDYYSDNPESCDRFEMQRMLMNNRQPQSMKNYTEKGFQVIRSPDHVVELIQDFWRKNHYKGKEERWSDGNIYINHWDNPTYLVSVEDSSLRGSGTKLKEHIWAAASATLESWTSEELQPCSLYGIRVYGEGAIMLPHVDRLPLVVSAMINVAQDVDEDWPTEVYDHQGNAHNVTLQPGDMLLFESSSVIHGHPFPLKGRFYALIFIHFEPTGNSLMHNESGYYYASTSSSTDVDRQYRDSVKLGMGGASANDQGDIPPYLNRFSPEEENWRELHPEGWTPPYPTLPPEAHIWAKKGNVQELEEHLNKQDFESKKTLLSIRDENGWQVLHQGVAGGNEEVVELLVKSGAEINSRTHGGYGETPLRMAEKMWGDMHPMVRFLKARGALSIGPEL
jgi:prolyl 4-hydroxylase